MPLSSKILSLLKSFCISAYFWYTGTVLLLVLVHDHLIKKVFKSEIFLLDFSQKILTDLKIKFIKFELSTTFRYWDAEMESRTQGSRPRTQKKSKAKPKNSFSEDRPLEANDRNARGPGP